MTTNTKAGLLAILVILILVFLFGCTTTADVPCAVSTADANGIQAAVCVSEGGTPFAGVTQSF